MCIRDRIYRTGDIGKRNAKGELIFVSRKDYQIKHMGHRIELGEIEANVLLVCLLYTSIKENQPDDGLCN